MVRPFAAALLSVCLFAGVYAYISFANSVKSAPLEIREAFSESSFSLVVTRTFVCVGDADFDVPSLLIRFRGQDLINRTDEIPVDEPIQLKSIDDVVSGDNELFIKAGSKIDDGWDDDDASPAISALRVQVFENETEIVDETFWHEPGTAEVSGSLSFGPSRTQQEHDH